MYRLGILRSWYIKFRQRKIRPRFNQAVEAVDDHTIRSNHEYSPDCPTCQELMKEVNKYLDELWPVKTIPPAERNKGE